MLGRSACVATTLLLAAGCSTSDDPPPSDVVIGPVQDPPAFVEGELRIAIETRDSGVLLPIVQPFGAGGDDFVTVESGTTLALGNAYPGSFRTTLLDAYMKCQVPTSFEIEDITADPALNAIRIDAETFEVAPEAEGDFQLVVSGTATYDADHGCVHEGSDGSSAFSIAESVAVRRPASVRINPPQTCEDSEVHYVVSGARLSTHGLGLGIRLLDSNGEAFSPSNVSPTRPIDLTVRAPAGALLGLHGEADGLAALVAQGAPGTVEIESELGPALELELIGPDRIDAMDVQFNLMGVAGGGIQDLESGATYGPGFARTSSSIDVTHLGLFVGSDRVCTGPSPLSFELGTSTPEACQVFAAEGHGDLSDGEPTGVSADVIESGNCRLRVEAPSFAGGEGLAAELFVTIVGAESLLSQTERE